MEIELLFIEGFSHEYSPWKSERLRGIDSKQTRWAWNFVSITQAQCFSLDEDRKLHPNMNAIRECRNHIASGKFHAIVVVDLCAYYDLFANELGPTLSAFTQAGGAIAFAVCDCRVVCPFLNSIFGTTWKHSIASFRRTWGVIEENGAYVRHIFGTDVRKINAKAFTLQSVPPHERCWGPSLKSPTHSLSPPSVGIDVTKSKIEEEEYYDLDYDVCVAMHQHGIGWMLYSGDMNLEQETITIVSNFIKSRSPTKPVSVLSSFEELSKLSREEFDAAENKKNAATKDFAVKNYEKAMEKYDAALAIYGSRTGLGEQLKEKVKIMSNKSECLLLQGHWSEAQTFASSALYLDPCHDESLLRRALARARIAEKCKAREEHFDNLKGAEADMIELYKYSQRTTASDAVSSFIRELRGESPEISDSGDGDTNGPNSIGIDSLNRIYDQYNHDGWYEQLFSEQSLGNGSKSVWTFSVDPKKHYDWLTDCYRMRADEDFNCSARLTHGLYKQDGTIVKDFLVFCRLAKQNGVIPDMWDWSAFLQDARELLPHGFKYSNAQEKYVVEKYFVLTIGESSLRNTAATVYGRAVNAKDKEPKSVSDVRDEVMGSVRADNRLCGSVGGAAIWTSLCADLKESWESLSGDEYYE